MEEYFMKIEELFDSLGVSFTQILGIRYDDNKGAFYFTDEMQSARFEILYDDAIEISTSSSSIFMGSFDFTKYEIERGVYRGNEYILLEDKKFRYLQIFLK